jgi:hypothetical protein
MPQLHKHLNVVSKAMAKHLLYITVLILLTSDLFGQKLFFETSRKDTSAIIKISMVELLENLEKYHGRWVETEGDFYFGFELCLLWCDKPAFKKAVPALWIRLNGFGGNYDTYSKINKAKVRVKGLIDVKQHGHSDIYPATIDKTFFFQEL